MEYRRVGNLGTARRRRSRWALWVSVGRGGRAVGQIDVDGARSRSACRGAASTSSTPPTCTPAGSSEEILGEALARPRRGPDRDQGPLPDERGGQRRRPVRATTSSDPSRRACVVSARTTSTCCRRTAGTARLPSRRPLRTFDTPRALGKSALHRRLELLGLAPHEGLVGVGSAPGPTRFVSQQIYYSLQCRDAETELVPVSIDQDLGILVWSPIAGGLLSGKYRRSGTEGAEGSRHLSGNWDEPPSTTRTSSTTRSSF